MARDMDIEYGWVMKQNAENLLNFAVEYGQPAQQSNIYLTTHGALSYFDSMQWRFMAHYNFTKAYK